MSQAASFILSAYSFIFKCSPDKLFEVGYQSKNGNPIPSFDENVLIDLCTEAKEIFENEDNILQINGNVIVVGDIHGSLHDLLRILNYFQENGKKVLFLGDYVDRGNFSLECITILFALKIIQPDLFFLIRGNHEFDTMCNQYGFKKEILNYYDPKNPIPSEKNGNNKSILTLNIDNEHSNEQNNQAYHEFLADHNAMNCYKYSETLYNAFITSFSYMPICAVVNDTTFCIHGGLSPHLDLIEDISTKISRPINQFEENALFTDIIWADPSNGFNCRFGENPRGRGYLFNRVAVNCFLAKNSLKRIVRAHECVKNGCQKVFDDKCITVFSASSYDKSMGNKSGILELFQQEDRVVVKTFPPIERLQKSDTVYYKVQNQNKNNQKIPFSLLHPCLNINSKINPSFNMNFNGGTPRRSRNTISSSNSGPLVKPAFVTTKSRRSRYLSQSPSIGNLLTSPIVEKVEKKTPKIMESHSMPLFF